MPLANCYPRARVPSASKRLAKSSRTTDVKFPFFLSRIFFYSMVHVRAHVWADLDKLLVHTFVPTFGRICNPPGLSISIFNALFRIKNPDFHCVGIAKLRLRECSANSFKHCRARAVYLNPDEHYFSLSKSTQTPICKIDTQPKNRVKNI